jgi:hypothetical protein
MLVNYPIGDFLTTVHFFSGYEFEQVVEAINAAMRAYYAKQLHLKTTQGHF